MTVPLRNSALLPAYDRAPINIVAGEGCEVIDDCGRRYLDCLGGIAACALGHAHPAIADAVANWHERSFTRATSAITNRLGPLPAN